MICSQWECGTNSSVKIRSFLKKIMSNADLVGDIFNDRYLAQTNQSNDSRKGQLETPKKKKFPKVKQNLFLDLAEIGREYTYIWQHDLGKLVIRCKANSTCPAVHCSLRVVNPTSNHLCKWHVILVKCCVLIACKLMRLASILRVTVSGTEHRRNNAQPF